MRDERILEKGLFCVWSVLDFKIFIVSGWSEDWDSAIWFFV